MSIKCPICGGKTNIINSRPLKNYTEIRRRRICYNCSFRFTTFETFEPVSDSFKKIWKEVCNSGN